MRKLILTALLTVAAAGCGPKTVVNTAPLTDEQKAQLRAEDKQIDAEENAPRTRNINKK